jgi:hypothetical protein
MVRGKTRGRHIRLDDVKPAHGVCGCSETTAICEAACIANTARFGAKKVAIECNDSFRFFEVDNRIDDLVER